MEEGMSLEEGAGELKRTDGDEVGDLACEEMEERM